METLFFILDYEVTPGGNVAAGLPRLELQVLSPIWQGETLVLDYPDGESHTLVGWQGPGDGGPCPLRVFWTRHQPGAPAACLAIGGDAGLRNATSGQGLPFLALAASMIPRQVLEIIGPQPQAPPLLLL
ncbi:MAG: hypothetical protein ACLP7A_05715 [Desulfobaccales bacterium]